MMAEHPNDVYITTGQAPAKTILLVEDDSSHADMLQFVLHSETPYRVIPFASGSGVIEHLADVKCGRPDLFLFDYKLPGMSGLELYDHLHAIDDFAGVPTIVITASFSKELEEAASLRNLPLIYKPFEIDEFLSLVENAFV